MKTLLLITSICFCTTLALAQDDLDHLDEAFRTQNFTWNDNYLPTIEFKYNQSGAPSGVSETLMSSRIGDAFNRWDRCLQ